MSDDKIILFGGTFDPIHIGHLVLAETAFEFIKAKKVIFIPCYKPPHKIDFQLSDWRHRVNMIKLSTKGVKYFEISLFEIENEGISYTYITVDYFSKKYKDSDLYFLIGYDSLLSLPTWENWRYIVEKVYFLVGDRNIEKKAEGELPEVILKKSIFFKSPIIEVSSTMIREKIKSKLSIKYLVPSSVENYIIKKKLYL
ncbi:MAG: nicotinate (nicotinamide) nucleotide adenylyltransferase [Elusimicrobiota bacterium]|nr:nicotinate (nicotinamide) nucleotide adenylyltransferase [Endomicrobiia bacterium]MDW8165434.1 nicotinate (nicotinamide) nucleotide adenylyltransferase [Elusimicrobiota bacterium]